ncbi:MAG TPA: SDR family NAD(P)-dependent oxidoreductase [Jatrophihabitans sp.]|nr:SDR family NAD(P)-dependent oxidoreductase [Jatrophihabitans sp.]
MDLTGNVALITGGTSGLGLAVAQQLLAAGSKIVLMGRSVERGEKAMAELGRDDVRFVPGDVVETADIRAAIEAARQLGRLGAVVNCAGLARSGRLLGRQGPFPLEEFELIVRMNLVGTFNVVRLAAEAMQGNDDQDGDRGVIVCTSSIAAYDGQRGQTAYAAAKAGICGMTLPLARDLAKYGIRVVTVAPGLFDTPMMATLPAPDVEALVAHTPYPKRLGQSEEFGALVAHVVGNRMLNGEVIRLDGAMRLAY